MKPIIIEMKDLSESTEIYEKKPNPAIVWFIYILLGIIVISVLWMAFSETEIVTEAPGAIVYTDDVSEVICEYNARIAKRIVEDGQYVTEGTVLYELKLLKDEKEQKDDGEDKEEDLTDGNTVIRAKENGYFYSAGGDAGTVMREESIVGYLFQKPKKTFRAQIYIDAGDIGQIREGQEVKLEIDVLPSAEYGTITGYVRSIAQEAEWNQESGISFFPACVEFEENALTDRDGRDVSLRSGLLCRAKIVTDRKKILSYVWEYIR